jgi:hypothetical protein
MNYNYLAIWIATLIFGYKMVVFLPEKPSGVKYILTFVMLAITQTLFPIKETLKYGRKKI